MSSRAASSLRFVRTGALVAAGAALLVGTASGMPSTDLSQALGRPEVLTPADPAGGADTLVTGSELTCPGPDQRGVQDATVPESLQSVTVSAVDAPAEAFPGGPAPDQPGSVQLVPVPQGPPPVDLSARGPLATLTLTDARGAVVRGSSGLAPGLSAAQLHLGTEAGRRGLELTACAAAGDDSWLVAGGGEAGRTERLVLVNPGPNAITADVAVLGAGGPVAASMGTGVVLAPGERSVLLLDALAPQEARPVVHVTSTGGPVVAALGERWLDGTVDLGQELTTPVAAPARDLVVPGLSVPDDLMAGSVLLRVAVPGSAGAVVQVSAMTGSGPVPLARAVTTVGGGQVVDIDLADLPPGLTGLRISADQPVVAAARIERRDVFPHPADFAWVPTVPAVTTLAGAPLASIAAHDLDYQVALSSVEGAVVDVVVDDPANPGPPEVRRVTVPAYGTVGVAVTLTGSSADSGGGSVWVRPSTGDVHAALLVGTRDSSGPSVSAMPLSDLAWRRPVVSVTPWRP